MPPELERCCCSSHQCGKVYDPFRKLYGVVLNRRAYDSHQKADHAAEVHRRAEKTCTDAVAAQEKEIVCTMDALSLEKRAALDAKAARFEMEGVRKTIAQISQIKDIIISIKDKIVSIGPAPPGPGSTLKIVEEKLIRYSAIREKIAHQHHQISIIGRGAYRKKDAVKEMRDQTKSDYVALQDLLKTYERSWKTAEEQHQAEREAFLQNGGTMFDSSRHFNPVFDGVEAVLQITILMVVACTIILGLPRRGAHWLFAMTEYVIQTVATKVFGAKAVPPYFSNLLSRFPRDVRTAIEHFDVESKSTILAACPKCHATYSPQIVDDVATYQERCNFRKYGSRCKELIVRPKLLRQHRVFVPIKPYVTFDMKDWMARLLSRRGYEEMMDAAWERMEIPSDGIMRDIFQGSIIQNFKGFDRRTHFSSSGDANAGRYLFSLNIDWFNPLGNKTSGKKISLGIIALACLNLPIELRYKPENMFLAGIIPGPEEPKLDAINPYLKPLVDILLLFWTGILFSATLLHTHGRLIFCALIALVCDLPAGRKVAGFASYSHQYFCSMCWCNKMQHTYNDFDYTSWKLRTNEDCRRHAETFRSATTEKEAASSFDRTGLRCSELLRLPYFDPSKMLVVDTMHNLFLGLMKEHFQNILGYRPKAKDWLSHDVDDIAIDIHIPPTEENPLPPTKAERSSIQKLIKFLQKPIDREKTVEQMVEKLGNSKSSIHVAAFIYVARGLSLITPDVKRVRKLEGARILLKWRLAEPENNQRPKVNEVEGSLASMRGRIFTTEEMEELWGDLERIVKPSWVSSVPSNISSICPKLKSDQWRSVGSLYLPVTLIRLWSGLDPQDERNMERQQLLHLTMLLCSAIAVATSRVTSDSHAQTFLSHMTEYRQELARLFPGYACRSNHHFAFHIAALLPMYGPVHGWWAFPFERMIGMLQRISTNYKQGEYETTIARSWSRSSNFRAFFDKATCPKPVRLCHDMFINLVQPQARNSLSLTPAVDDDYDLDSEDSGLYAASRSKPIQANILAAFSRSYPNISGIPATANFFNRITHQGITYSTQMVHEGNSGILQKSSAIPFRIENILEFPPLNTATLGNDNPCKGHWLVVRRHKEVKVKSDPYLRYPRLRAKMWAPELASSQEVIPMSNVDGHFASCLVSWEEQEVAVIVSLTRTHDL